MTTVQKNQETVQRLYDQALNKHNMALLKDMVSDDFVGVRGAKGPAAFEAPLVDLINRPEAVSYSGSKCPASHFAHYCF